MMSPDEVAKLPAGAWDQLYVLRPVVKLVKLTQEDIRDINVKLSGESADGSVNKRKRKKSGEESNKSKKQRVRDKSIIITNEKKLPKNKRKSSSSNDSSLNACVSQVCREADSTVAPGVKSQVDVFENPLKAGNEQHVKVDTHTKQSGEVFRFPPNVDSAAERTTNVASLASEEQDALAATLPNCGQSSNNVNNRKKCRVTCKSDQILVKNKEEKPQSILLSKDNVVCADKVSPQKVVLNKAVTDSVSYLKEKYSSGIKDCESSSDEPLSSFKVSKLKLTSAEIKKRNKNAGGGEKEPRGRKKPYVKKNKAAKKEVPSFNENKLKNDDLSSFSEIHALAYINKITNISNVEKPSRTDDSNIKKGPLIETSRNISRSPVKEPLISAVCSLPLMALKSDVETTLINVSNKYSTDLNIAPLLNIVPVESTSSDSPSGQATEQMETHSETNKRKTNDVYCYSDHESISAPKEQHLPECATLVMTPEQAVNSQHQSEHLSESVMTPEQVESEHLSRAVLLNTSDVLNRVESSPVNVYETNKETNNSIPTQQSHTTLCVTVPQNGGSTERTFSTTLQTSSHCGQNTVTTVNINVNTTLDTNREGKTSEDFHVLPNSSNHPSDKSRCERAGTPSVLKDTYDYTDCPATEGDLSLRYEEMSTDMNNEPEYLSLSFSVGSPHPVEFDQYVSEDSRLLSLCKTPPLRCTLPQQTVPTIKEEGVSTVKEEDVSTLAPVESPRTTPDDASQLVTRVTSEPTRGVGIKFNDCKTLQSPDTNENVTKEHKYMQSVASHLVYVGNCFIDLRLERYLLSTKYKIHDPFYDSDFNKRYRDFVAYMQKTKPHFDGCLRILLRSYSLRSLLLALDGVMVKNRPKLKLPFTSEFLRMMYILASGQFANVHTLEYFFSCMHLFKDSATDKLGYTLKNNPIRNPSRDQHLAGNSSELNRMSSNTVESNSALPAERTRSSESGTPLVTTSAVRAPIQREQMSGNIFQNGSTMTVEQIRLSGTNPLSNINSALASRPSANVSKANDLLPHSRRFPVPENYLGNTNSVPNVPGRHSMPQVPPLIPDKRMFDRLPNERNTVIIHSASRQSSTSQTVNPRALPPSVSQAENTGDKTSLPRLFPLSSVSVDSVRSEGSLRHPTSLQAAATSSSFPTAVNNAPRTSSTLELLLSSDYKENSRTPRTSTRPEALLCNAGTCARTASAASATSITPGAELVAARAGPTAAAEPYSHPYARHEPTSTKTSSQNSREQSHDARVIPRSSALTNMYQTLRVSPTIATPSSQKYGGGFGINSSGGSMSTPTRFVASQGALEVKSEHAALSNGHQRVVAGPTCSLPSLPKYGAHGIYPSYPSARPVAVPGVSLANRSVLPSELSNERRTASGMSPMQMYGGHRVQPRSSGGHMTTSTQSVAPPDIMPVNRPHSAKPVANTNCILSSLLDAGLKARCSEAVLASRPDSFIVSRTPFSRPALPGTNPEEYWRVSRNSGIDISPVQRSSSMSDSQDKLSNSMAHNNLLTLNGTSGSGLQFRLASSIMSRQPSYNNASTRPPATSLLVAPSKEVDGDPTALSTSILYHQLNKNGPLV